MPTFRWDEADQAIAVAVVAHGANNDTGTPFFEGVAQGLTEHGVSSLRFDFAYATAGRRYPDRPAIVLEEWRAALREARERGGGVSLVASGKSFGGRMASLLAAEEGERFEGRALVFFGYPLHAPGKADRPRDEHLPDITVPMLFIEGTSDPLARFDLMQDLVKRLGPTARLHVVEGGNHSFRVRGAKRPDQEIGRELGAVAAGFIAEVVG